jgi:hypothetical protein
MKPTDAAYVLLSNAVYIQANSKVGPTAPPGWTLIDKSEPNPSGMYAAAFQNNSTNEIVIAYEGTNLNNCASISPTNLLFCSGQSLDDAAITYGYNFEANADALAFAKQVSAKFGQGGKIPIYVTGHSLGGEEAEYVDWKASAVSGLTISGGDTFGAPGVPGFSGNGKSYNLTDYIYCGDRIGMYSAIGDSHVGNEIKIGSKSIVTEQNKLLASGNLSEIAQAGAWALSLHQLNNYAKYFRVTLPSTNSGGTSSLFNDVDFMNMITHPTLFSSGGVSGGRSSGDITLNSICIC